MVFENRSCRFWKFFDLEKLEMSAAPRASDTIIWVIIIPLTYNGMDRFAAAQIHHLQIRSCYPKPSSKLQVKQLEYVS